MACPNCGAGIRADVCPLCGYAEGPWGPTARYLGEILEGRLRIHRFLGSAAIEQGERVMSALWDENRSAGRDVAGVIRNRGIRRDLPMLWRIRYG